MMRTIKILSVTMLLAALLFGLLYVGGSKLLPIASDNSVSEKNSGISVSDKVGSKASFFDLPDVNDNRIKLSDFENTPLIVFFWSTWDSNSADQVKIFDDYLASVTSSGKPLVKVVGIDSQEDLSIGSSFVRRGGYNVPVAVDSSGATTENYGVKGLPTLFFIDRDGIIREVWNGVLSLGQIVNKAEIILKY